MDPVGSTCRKGLGRVAVTKSDLSLSFPVGPIFGKLFRNSSTGFCQELFMLLDAGFNYISEHF